MELKLKLTFILAISAFGTFLCLSYYPFADDSLPPVILSAEEIRAFSNEEVYDLYIQFSHRWGRANRDRRIFIAKSGEVYVSDYQEASRLKELALSGELDTGDFTEGEYDVLMRDNVEYNIISKGTLDISTVRALINMVADLVEGSYGQSLTATDYPDQTIGLFISNGEKAICIVETVGVDYNNPERLQFLYTAESFLEKALSEIELVEAEAHELTEFQREHYNPVVRKAMIEQSKLAGNYDYYDYSNVLEEEIE